MEDWLKRLGLRGRNVDEEDEHKPGSVGYDVGSSNENLMAETWHSFQHKNKLILMKKHKSLVEAENRWMLKSQLGSELMVFDCWDCCAENIY